MANFANLLSNDLGEEREGQLFPMRSMLTMRSFRSCRSIPHYHEDQLGGEELREGAMFPYRSARSLRSFARMRSATKSRIALKSHDIVSDNKVKLTDSETEQCTKFVQLLSESEVLFTKSELVATIRLLDLPLTLCAVDRMFELELDVKGIEEPILPNEFVSLMEHVKGTVDEETWISTVSKLEHMVTESFRDTDKDAFRILMKREEGSLLSCQNILQICTFISILYYLIVAPLHIPATRLYGDHQHIFIGCEIMLTIVATLDFQVKYRAYQIGFIENDCCLTKQRNAVLVAILSAFPLDIAGYLSSSPVIEKLGYCLRIANGFKLRSFFSLDSVRMVSRATVQSAFGWFPMVRFFLMTSFGIHFFACLHVAVNSQDDKDFFHGYDISLYWTLYTLSSVGYGDVAVSGLESRLLANVCCVAAIMWNGILVGKIASLMMVDTAGEHRQLMYRTMQVIQHYHLPDDVTEDVLSLQHHLLSEKIRLRSAVEVVNLLPPTVQETMAIYIRVECLNRLPIFRASTTKCKVALAECLKDRIVNRDFAIVQEGEEGSAMFFIAHGFAGVTIGDVHVATISTGSFFGELSLLAPGNKRAATVRSGTLCELLILEADDFQVITKTFPCLKWNIECEVHRRMGSLPDLSKPTEDTKKHHEQHDHEEEQSPSHSSVDRKVLFNAYPFDIAADDVDMGGLGMLSVSEWHQSCNNSVIQQNNLTPNDVTAAEDLSIIAMQLRNIFQKHVLPACESKIHLEKTPDVEEGDTESGISPVKHKKDKKKKKRSKATKREKDEEDNKHDGEEDEADDSPSNSQVVFVV